MKGTNSKPKFTLEGITIVCGVAMKMTYGPKMDYTFVWYLAIPMHLVVDELRPRGR